MAELHSKYVNNSTNAFHDPRQHPVQSPQAQKQKRYDSKKCADFSKNVHISENVQISKNAPNPL